MTELGYTLGELEEGVEVAKAKPREHDYMEPITLLHC